MHLHKWPVAAMVWFLLIPPFAPSTTNPGREDFFLNAPLDDYSILGRFDDPAACQHALANTDAGTDGLLCYGTNQTWTILLPPDFGTSHPDTSAPLSKWFWGRTFLSAAKCHDLQKEMKKGSLCLFEHR